MFNMLNKQTVEYWLLMKIKVLILIPGSLLQEKYASRSVHKHFKRQTGQREIFSSVVD